MTILGNNRALPEIAVCPLKQFLALAKQGGAKAALISTSFDLPRGLPEGMDCVILHYDDIDREIPGRSLSGQDAKRAADFIRSHSRFQGILYCCCDSGVSRSSAMAAAATRFLGRDDLPIWRDPRFSPNPLVYAAVCRSLGMALSDEELDFRLELSRRALRDAIRGQKKA